MENRVVTLGPLHVQSARLHVGPGAHSGVRMETSGAFGLNTDQSEGENPSGQSASPDSDSASNQTQLSE